MGANSGHSYGRGSGSVASRLFYLETTIRAATQELTALREQVLGKVCPRCDEAKELDNFGLIHLSTGRTRRQYLCNACRAELARIKRTHAAS